MNLSYPAQSICSKFIKGSEYMVTFFIMWIVAENFKFNQENQLCTEMSAGMKIVLFLLLIVEIQSFLHHSYVNLSAESEYAIVIKPISIFNEINAIEKTKAYMSVRRHSTLPQCFFNPTPTPPSHHPLYFGPPDVFLMKIPFSY